MEYTTRGLRRRRSSDDKWEVRLSHTDPLTGKQVSTYHTITGKTKAAAVKARDELRFGLQDKGTASSTKSTVREFLDSFIDYKENSGTIEPSTVTGYRCEAKMAYRYIGDVRLSELDIPAVAQWMADMSKDYAPKTCAKAFRLLKQALKFAVAQDILKKNPCDFTKPPKRVKSKINTLDRTERSRMLDLAFRAMPNPLAIAIGLALTTGMRRGEVCALRWSDMNEDGTISVARALGNAGGTFYEKEPKTDSSCRTIPLTPSIASALRAIRADKEYVCKSLGVPFGDPYLLGAPGLDSKPYSPSMLSKDFTAFCKMNGFTCTFHDLRHTFATFMIGAGVDVRTVASYLGHASVSMTLNTYADVDPEAKMSAVDKIETAFDSQARIIPMQSREPQTDPEHRPLSDLSAEELRILLAQTERKEAMGQ